MSDISFTFIQIDKNMSYTEMHTGTLKKVSENFTTDELVRFLNDNKEFYVDDLEEKLEDEYHFFELFNKETKELIFVLNNNTLYQVLNHYKTDESEYLQDVRVCEDGNINFNLIFYNGGTYFSEMLEEGLNKL